MRCPSQISSYTHTIVCRSTFLISLFLMLSTYIQLTSPWADLPIETFDFCSNWSKSFIVDNHGRILATVISWVNNMLFNVDNKDESTRIQNTETQSFSARKIRVILRRNSQGRIFKSPRVFISIRKHLSLRNGRSKSNKHGTYDSSYSHPFLARLLLTLLNIKKLQAVIRSLGADSV